MRAHWVVSIAAVLAITSSLPAADHSIEPIVSRIRRQPVDSSALTAVGYSKKLHALEIEFHDGLIYRYLEVPPSIFHLFLEAESKARFYNRNIRGKYRCLRVKPHAG